MIYYLNTFLDACVTLWVTNVIINDRHSHTQNPESGGVGLGNGYAAEVGEKFFNIPINGEINFTEVATSSGGILVIVVVTCFFLYFVALPAIKPGINVLAVPEPKPVVETTFGDQIGESLLANASEILTNIFHNMFN